MKISKLIGIVASIMLVASASFADVASDMASAYALYNSKDYVAAQAAYAKVIEDYPTASVNTLARAQLMIAKSLMSVNGGTGGIEVQEAGELGITSYPTAKVGLLAQLQYQIGGSLLNQGKSVEGQAAYEKILTDYPTASPSMLALAQSRTGLALTLQGKQVEANDAYIKAVIAFARVPDVTNEKLAGAFDKVDPVLMTTADYATALQSIIKATPATEANAEFLGRIKSEIEKMK